MNSKFKTFYKLMEEFETIVRIVFTIIILLIVF